MAAFSPIVSTFARMSTQAKPVSACVKVRVHTITATEEAMPGGQAYMVWLNRNGKARGTQVRPPSIPPCPHATMPSMPPCARRCQFGHARGCF
mmetsp:Transcript_17383/g.45082  ORF Transcript_17383/g.45082 Transcript_17383/m.45082 type:complete len:93 (+) Transcript_17383:183-461(+)